MTVATSKKQKSHKAEIERSSQRRVILAAIVGTTIEWYDFFIYAFAAGLVFSDLFFEPVSGQFAQIFSFATVGISFFFRPLGAAIAGHLGDKYGRRFVLMVTLILMGLSTTLVGLLPTYASIGIMAPTLMIILRIMQGISAGGEWGGAALLAVEHAPAKKRGLFGAAPQIGVPLGLLLASSVMGLMSLIAPDEAFKAWGWRIPFLLSIVLIWVGFYVRRRVEETPVFAELAERQEEAKLPIVQLFRHHALLVITAALVFAGNNTVGYMTTGGFIQRYATNPDGPIALPTSWVLWAVTGSAVVWLFTTLLAGWLSDYIGRRTTYILGWIMQLAAVFALFPLVNTGSISLLFLSLIFLCIGLGFTYGPQAALYSELFPAAIRLSGVSIAYALGAVIGGAFAPAIAQTIVQTTGSTSAVTWYLAGMTVIGLIATLVLRDHTGAPL